jgi:polysaccharide pyruvyl transferase CsaB
MRCGRWATFTTVHPSHESRRIEVRREAMARILIFCAAGYGNLGDDAILEGMLAQLRGVADADYVVAGGEGLHAMATRLGITPVRDDGAKAWLDAVEGADLVLIGGGGLFYDSTFVPRLTEFLQPRSNSLYQAIKVAAAGRTAGKPVALYGIGVGPLLTEAGRHAARFAADCAQWITTRDAHSTDALLDIGVPRSRVHTACDPALFLPSPDTDIGAQWLRERGFNERPRPWVVLNARPWYHFPASEAREDRRSALRQSLSTSADRILDRVGGSLVLLPLQIAHEDDREVLHDVGRALEHKDQAVLVDASHEPGVMQAMIGQMDLLVGMRLHSLILAANARVPFVAISYDPKVDAFASEMGARDRCFPIEGLAPEKVASAVATALHDRDIICSQMAAAVDRIRDRGAMAARLVAATLDGTSTPDRGVRRVSAPPTPPSPMPASDIRPRVLMQVRADYEANPGGGDAVQIRATRQALTDLGVSVSLTPELRPDLADIDIVHTFHLTRPLETAEHCANARRQGKPVVLSTIYWDARECMHKAPKAVDPSVEPAGWELAAFAATEANAAVVAEMADLLLPNSDAERDLLERNFGVPPERCIVVPNAVDERFFDATPDDFVREYGMRDFVLYVGRVERRKNQYALLAALRDIDLPVVLIGPLHDQEYFERCRGLATDRVTFVTEILHERLPSAYAAARVHVVPSWYETPGLVSLEAAAAGCNIVSTDRGSAREYFGDMAWYCSPDDIASIRHAVLAAWEAPKSDRLREHVRNHFTWQAAAERTLYAYRLALGMNARNDPQAEVARQAAQIEAYLQYVRALNDTIAAQREEFEKYVGSTTEYVRSLVEYVRSLEQSCGDYQGQVQAMSSRRLYRWSEWLALRLRRLLRRQ